MNGIFLKPHTYIGATSMKYTMTHHFAFQIEIAVIYGCILEKLYVAVKGHGSYCGEEKLAVSGQNGMLHPKSHI